MNAKLAIAIVCLAIAGCIIVFFCGEAFGMDFTTDERSLLHVGVGAAGGAVVDTLLYQTTKDIPRWGRIGLATLAVAVPAAVKEYVLDGTPDAGDLFYGVASALAGAAAADYGLEWAGYVYAQDDAVMVGLVWRQ